MKKIAIFFLMIIIIISTIAYLYLNHIAIYNIAQKENAKFEIYKDKEIQGIELTTIINKAIDSNEKNTISKDNEGKYIDNGKDSINIDIKFIDDDVIYNIEKIYDKGTDNFLQYYRYIMFKCNEVRYHSSTGKIKYMLFEQITQ